ncbi:DUF3231 family protein [Rossellomorea vietnamensis]|uniref:DUF3231 family protein n=1 Tax=Rossellomorea vietnamensis TaxID=218284 RepID=UPI003CEE3B06
MANPFEAVWNTIKTMVDNQDEPKVLLHIIEAGDCWKYITLMEEFIRYEEIGMNTTVDDEVREMLTDVIRVCESQVEKMTSFMKTEGIPLPDVTSSKPESQPNSIPLGVKLRMMKSPMELPSNWSHVCLHAQRGRQTLSGMI